MTSSTMKVWLATWKGDSHPLAVRWNEGQLRSFVSDYCDRYGASVDDFNFTSFYLPNFKYVILEALEKKGIAIDHWFECWNNRDLLVSSTAKGLLAMFLGSQDWDDPMAALLDLLEEEDPLKGTGIPHSQNGQVIEKNHVQELIEFFEQKAPTLGD